MEAVALAVLGGVAGIALGVTGSYAIQHFTQWRTIIQPQTVLMAFGFAAAVGVLSGLYPARKAARIQPIDALRHE